MLYLKLIVNCSHFHLVISIYIYIYIQFMEITRIHNLTYIFCIIFYSSSQLFQQLSHYLHLPLHRNYTCRLDNTLYISNHGTSCAYILDQVFFAPAHNLPSLHMICQSRRSSHYGASST